MSRFTRLGRVGRRSLGAVLLLACLIVGTGAMASAQAPTDPSSAVQVRIGDLASDAVIRHTWSIMTPEQKALLGVNSLDEFRNAQLPQPSDLPAVTAGITDVSESVAFEFTTDVPVSGATGAAGALLSGTNNCDTRISDRELRVHESETFWCYDGTLVQPTPYVIRMKVRGYLTTFWDGLVQVTRTGYEGDIWKTHGGHGDTYTRDKSSMKILEQRALLGQLSQYTCYRYTHWIDKRQNGDGSEEEPYDSWRNHGSTGC